MKKMKTGVFLPLPAGTLKILPAVMAAFLLLAGCAEKNIEPVRVLPRPGAMDQPAVGELPRVSLRIAPADMERIAQVRAKAIKAGYLLDDFKDWVPGELNPGKLKVEVRLKGDMEDHWRRDKHWSLRIKVEGNANFREMTRFSLQHPDTRRGLWEFLFLEEARRQGLLAPRYEFVNYELNGESMGVFALEEAMAASVLTSASRPAGQIFKLDENPVWQWRSRARAEGLAPLETWQELKLYLFDRKLRATGGSDLKKLPQAKQERKRARKRFKAVLLQRDTASRHFDPEKTALWLALADFYGVRHMTQPNQLRFYQPVDPARGFEPILFDTHVGAIAGALGNYGQEILWTRLYYMMFTDLLLQDEKIRTLYLGHLEKMVHSKYIIRELVERQGAKVENLLRHIRPTMARFIPRHEGDFPRDNSSEFIHEPMSLDALRHNLVVLKADLEEMKARGPWKKVRAGVSMPRGGKVTLTLRNESSERVEIGGIGLADKTVLTVEPKMLEAGSSWVVMEVALPRGKIWHEKDAWRQVLLYRTSRDKTVRIQPIFNWDDL